jgi:hypothetical protein
MKKIANIVAILLGVAFIIFGLSFFVPAIKSVLPAPSAPASPEAAALTKAYFTAMTGTSYLAIIKALEVIGGLMLLCACSRGWGVALIGAITFNIVLVNVLIKQVYDPVVIILTLAVLFLAWVGRKGFCCLACCGSGECLGTCGCCNKDGQSGGCCSTEKPASTGCCGGK